VNGQPPTTPLDITLDHNYLVTKRLSFEPVAAADAPWVPGKLSLPWKNIVLKAAPGKGRIIPGIAFASDTWQQVLTTDPIYARLPDAVKGGANGCKVWYVNLIAATGTPLQGLDNENLDFEGSWPRTLVRDMSQATVNPRFGYEWIDGHGTEFTEFSNTQNLSAAIGEFQMKYADTPLLEPGMSADFTWGKARGSSGVKTSFRWETAPAATTNVSTLSQAASALLQSKPSNYYGRDQLRPPADPNNNRVSALEWLTMATIPQSFVRCTVFHAVDYDSVEVGVKSFTQQTTSNGRTVTFELNADPWKLMGSPIPDFSTKQ
jgi:hypothetical protein